MSLNKVILRIPYSSVGRAVNINEHLEHIYLSSPNLIPEIKKSEEKKLTPKEEKKLTETLYKYKSRLSTRSTPFGLFAGIGMVNVGKGEKIQLPLKKDYQKNLRLDMNYLAALVRHIEQIPAIQSRINWSVNTSLYKQHTKYRYVEHYFTKANKLHKLSAVDYSEYLEKIVNKAQGGARLGEIAACIVQEGISLEDAKAFVQELINNQLLVSNLEPSITTSDILKDLILNIAKIKCVEAKNIGHYLQKIQTKIEELNLTQPGEEIKLYENLILDIEKIGVEFEKSKLFQIDLYIPKIKGAIDPSILVQIEKSIDFLKYFYTDFDPLKQEKEKFSKRYEDNEIALFKVFDAENGMNFTENSSLSPLIDNVGISYQEKAELKIKQTAQEAYLNELYKDAMEQKKGVVKLSEKHLPEEIKNNKTKKQLPPSYSSMFTVFTDRNGEEKIFLESAGGTSALNLLGRFAHLDENYNSYIKKLAKQEEAILSEAIVADIVHLPEDRVGNVLIRPVLHPYQIPYLSKVNVEKEFELPVSDLFLSLKDNRFILRSKKLNKEIIPRLSNAHNYTSPLSLPIYKFLCGLQNQDIIPWLGFNWGHLRSYYNYSPRVEYNNVILSLAKWNFENKDLKSIFASLKKGDGNFMAEIAKWQRKHNVPNVFLLAAGDNELYINLTDPLACNIFVNEVKRKASFTLHEYLMKKENDFVKGDGGNYAHQFVASFINEDYKIPKFDHKITENTVKRKFTVGSEWFYFKIYAGAKTLDNILQNELRTLINNLIEREIIDKWFFLRYNDPDLHLRIRLRFTDTNQIQFVIQQLNQFINPLIDSKVIHAFQLDTYNRELERYGTNTIEISESLFYEDSQIITDFLTLIDGDPGEEIKWLFAFKLVDCFLSDLQFDIDQKIEFSNLMTASFSKEFNFQKEQRTTLNKTYRDKRALINEMLQQKLENKTEWQPIFDLLKHKSQRSTSLINKLLEIQEKGELEMEFYQLISSYTHMSLNRIFLSKPRLNEAAIYFLLCKYYRSIKAYNPKKELKLTHS